METENGFKLKFGSLSSGNHEFNYEIDSQFFANRKESLVENGLVNVILDVEKDDLKLALRFEMTGAVEQTCDRCLREIDYPIDFTGILHVKLTDKEMEDEAELIYVPSNTIELNLEDLFYDSLVIGLPMKIECEDAIEAQECDPQVVEILNAKKDEDENPNPEWLKLKDLFKTN